MIKFYFSLILVAIFYLKASAQKFPVDTLFKGGKMDNRINVVILGDGFTEAELPKFRTEAKLFSEFFLAYTPYDQYKNYFNFFAISTPSKESGVSNPGTAPDRYPAQPIGPVDNFFGSSFGTNTHRLVTVGKYDVLYAVLANNLPTFDLVVVLANTPWYGGSGGSIAVHTLHEAANLIGVHEIGHTFSFLNDEYWNGFGFEAPNMTMTKSPELVKWKNWLNESPVGIFRHEDGLPTGWYKPTQANCLMEQLGMPLCPVCREATTERILQIVNPIEDFSPGNKEVVNLVGQRNLFNLQLVKPQPNTLKCVWTLNGKILGNGSDSLNISEDQLAGKTGLLRISVFDSTVLSRAADSIPDRIKHLSWVLSKFGLGNLTLVAGANSLCAGDSTSITAFNCKGKLKWSTGETTQSIVVRNAENTNYTATCTTPESFQLVDSITIFRNPLPVATASNDGPYYEGSTIKLSATGGVGYSWTGPQNFSSPSAESFISSAATANSGSYKVKVRDLNNCSATATTDVKVDRVLATNPANRNWVKVFPNPATDYLKFETEGNEKSELMLFDVEGKEITRKWFRNSIELKTERLVSGVYVFRIRGREREISGKVSIQQK